MLLSAFATMKHSELDLRHGKNGTQGKSRKQDLNKKTNCVELYNND